MRAHVIGRREQSYEFRAVMPWGRTHAFGLLIWAPGREHHATRSACGRVLREGTFSVPPRVVGSLFGNQVLVDNVCKLCLRSVFA
jgi:hypothetical protein